MNASDIFDGLFILAIYLGGLFVVLGIGGIIADYVIPHIKPLERWIESLPAFDDDEDE